ncbi:MAG: glycosyltransferase family 2 protein [Phycisphaerales bacterium]
MARLEFVVPAFDAEATLGATLRSLVAQTMPDWHAIVVDDGSRDRTAEVARKIADSRIRVLRQENRGLAGARNAGFAAGDADAVCFLDADDAVDATFAERMLGALGGCDAAACEFRYVGPGLEELGWAMRLGDQDLAVERLIEFNPLAVGGVLARRGALRRAFDGAARPFDGRLRVHEDWDLWLRMTVAGARWAPVMHEPLFAYRLRAGSMSSDLAVMWRVGLDVIERTEVGAATKARARRRWTIRHAARAAARGDGRLAREWLGAVMPMEADDESLLAEALRWALGHEHRTSPDRVDAERARTWVERARAALEGVAAWERIEPGLRFEGDRWARAAEAIGEMAAGYRRVVIVGMGRNGRSLVEALAWCAGRFAWIDEDTSATAPSAMARSANGRTMRRIGFEELCADDLAVVTPQSPGALLERSRRAGRVVLVDSLMPAKR